MEKLSLFVILTEQEYAKPYPLLLGIKMLWAEGDGCQSDSGLLRDFMAHANSATETKDGPFAARQVGLFASAWAANSPGRDA